MIYVRFQDQKVPEEAAAPRLVARGEYQQRRVRAALLQRRQ